MASPPWLVDGFLQRNVINSFSAAHGTALSYLLLDVNAFSPTFSVLCNGTPFAFFGSGQGIRQRDPLSPSALLYCDGRLLERQ